MVRPSIQLISMMNNPSSVPEKPPNLTAVHKPLLNNMRAALPNPATLALPDKKRIVNKTDYPPTMAATLVKNAVLIKIKAEEREVPTGWMPHLNETALLEQERELRRTVQRHPDRFYRNMMLLGMGLLLVVFYQMLRFSASREHSSGPTVLS
ncbi:hypothetical protein [Sodalis praecaptivus]|uniref:hypothetical protein n=1 Tax=Sodalis TaxID=84565 RepID=UPI00046D5157|nr:hypothetical protein [Sodalis praecaptivus]